MLQHLRTRTPFILGLAVLFIGIFVGERWGLYYSIPYLDKIMHAVGGLVAAWLGLAIFQTEISQLSWHRQLTLILSFTALVGLAWEFAEYAANFTYDSWPLLYHYFHGGDLADTLADLVADLSGGAVFAVWALWKEKN